MEYPVLTLLHVFFGALWAGGAISAGFFIVPSVLEAGPAGGAVMAGVVKRKFPVVMSTAALVVLLTGVRLYMVRAKAGAGWITSPEGIVLGLGGLLGLGAFAIGLFVQKPLTEKLGAAAAKAASAGGPPPQEVRDELAALNARLGRVARLTAFHLLAALLLMASHRLALLG